MPQIEASDKTTTVSDSAVAMYGITLLHPLTTTLHAICSRILIGIYPPSSAAKVLRLLRSWTMVRVRSMRKYMSTEKEAAGATVTLNSPGIPDVSECVCVKMKM